MTFPNFDAPPRTDEDFRARTYEEYHHGNSTMELLPVDMIKSFVPDYLHFLCLGGGKFLLKFIKNHKKNILSTEWWGKVNARIEEMKPREFQRKLRSFELLIDGDKRLNLEKLQIACTIFAHKRFEEFYKEAGIVMRQFLDDFSTDYHARHLTYCIHLFCHVEEFCRMYGPLDEFSAFEYESYIYTIKQLVHTNNKILPQIANRITESYNASAILDIQDSVKKTEVRGKITETKFNQIKYKDTTFVAKSDGQDWVLLKGGKILKLEDH